MKKTPVFVSILIVVGMLATTAFAPTSGAVKHKALPFEFHSGLVTAYTPEVGLMIQDDSGNTATFSLDSNVKILPPWSSGVQVGSHVTLIVQSDEATGGMQAIGIFVLEDGLGEAKEPPPSEPIPTPTEKPLLDPVVQPTKDLSGTPSGEPSVKPTPSTTEIPTEKPAGALIDQIIGFLKGKPADQPAGVPPEKILTTPIFTPTMTPTATPAP